MLHVFGNVTVEAEVRARESWQATRSDRGVVSISAVSISVVVVCEKFLLVKLQEKMPPHRDLAAMEQRYQNMLQAALAPFLAAQQTQATCVQAQNVPPPALVGAEPEPVQLSAKAKHLRDFRKYNPKTFDGSMDNPTKAQMWLTSIEKIFRYMKCPEDQKV
ncbi:histone H2B.3-like [Cucumis melo var. makuwa]|uniref:Histone H2B.3-like n=1 Tax=Cucumis melo var. makuwa TaxID=1194695 RepID=A0A5A7VEJ1_CUCMM|nr:histone H2B.3-like [Cucumis melo var. makuwa]